MLIAQCNIASDDPSQYTLFLTLFVLQAYNSKEKDYANKHDSSVIEAKLMVNLSFPLA